MYLDVHGLAFETSICYRQDQSGIAKCVVVLCSPLVYGVSTPYIHDLLLCCQTWYITIPHTPYEGALFRRLPHAKGANSLCIVLFSSLLLSCVHMYTTRHHSSSESPHPSIFMPVLAPSSQTCYGPSPKARPFGRLAPSRNSSRYLQ